MILILCPPAMLDGMLARIVDEAGYGVVEIWLPPTWRRDPAGTITLYDVLVAPPASRETLTLLGAEETP